MGPFIVAFYAGSLCLAMDLMMMVNKSILTRCVPIKNNPSTVQVLAESISLRDSEPWLVAVETVLATLEEVRNRDEIVRGFSVPLGKTEVTLENLINTLKITFIVSRGASLVSTLLIVTRLRYGDSHNF